MENSATGTRTRVARVRAEYPNQLDYSGACKCILDYLAVRATRTRMRCFSKRFIHACGMRCCTNAAAVTLRERSDEKLSLRQKACQENGVSEMYVVVVSAVGHSHIVGSSSQANCLMRNTAMDDSIGGS